MDDDLVERVARAIIAAHKEIWPGSWPAIPEAKQLARAAIAECFKWTKYEDQETLPSGRKAVYSPNETNPLRFVSGPLSPPNDLYPRWFIDLPELPKKTEKEKTP